MALRTPSTFSERGLAHWFWVCALALVSTNSYALYTEALVNIQHRQITLTIGSATTAIDTVSFPVAAANVGLGPVTGTPSILITLSVRKPGSAAKPITGTQTLTVDSSSPLSCVAGSGCGSTTIPMSTIGWTSVVLQTGANAGKDIQNGSFNGSASQVLSNTSIPNTSEREMTITNTLTFTFSNAAVYPAGTYRSRVVFTASSI